LISEKTNQNIQSQRNEYDKKINEDFDNSWRNKYKELEKNYSKTITSIKEEMEKAKDTSKKEIDKLLNKNIELKEQNREFKESLIKLYEQSLYKNLDKEEEETVAKDSLKLIEKITNQINTLKSKITKSKKKSHKIANEQINKSLGNTNCFIQLIAHVQSN